jgi:hypothetical protein
VFFSERVNRAYEDIGMLNCARSAMLLRVLRGRCSGNSKKVEAVGSVPYIASPLNGQLELTTASGVAITTFTQAEIDAGCVVFVHSGAAAMSDSFTFTVSDGAGGTVGTTILPSPCRRSSYRRVKVEAVAALGGRRDRFWIWFGLWDRRW